MKELFSLDNPFIQLLMKVGDMILANFLFLACCLPIVTIGASLAALQKVMQNLVFERENGVFRSFFKAFRENFKQSTVLWLLLAVFAVGMAANYLLIMAYLSGTAAMILKCVVGVAVIAIICIASYLFPLIVRYRNTLREHGINAAILALCKLPRTAGMFFLNTALFWIAYFSMATFFKTLVFWLFIGFAFIQFMDCILLSPVFEEVEKAKETGTGISIMN